jgi:hypothetical protein
MNSTISLVFGIHNHQPVGNFEHTFEDAFQQAYRPFLEVFAKNPWFPFSLHYSGGLLEWIENNHPEIFDLIREMSDRGQVELMTGGFYEPILPIVPDPDKKGQIRKLSRYLKDNFGHKPKGMWLAERVWEPHLVKPLAEAGVRYVPMDDSHFKSSGLTSEHLYGYYTTEEQGASLAVFPISERLRYLIPFRPPEETIEFLRELASPSGERLVVIADDGEKFGVWPDTHEWVYKKGWLRKFVETLKRHRKWLRLLTFEQALREHRSLGTVYLPTASYTEMMEWVLPPDQTNELDRLRRLPESEPYLPFLRGGFWRNYLAKYRESSNLHKKMLLVSRAVHSLDGAAKEKALNHLWAGQCNCGYWHGVFGGLYLNHIRAAIYTNLIAAEVEVDRAAAGPRQPVSIEVTDFYRDGGRCLLVRTPDLNLYFDLDRGGTLFELDHKAKRFNLLNTLTRRKEAYHQRLLKRDRKGPPSDKAVRSIHDLVRVKEEGLENLLHYDWYRRSAMIDHFLGPQADLESFRHASYPEAGDFVDQPYEVAWEESGDEAVISFVRDGKVKHRSDTIPVRLTRTIAVRSGAKDIEFAYQLESGGDQPLETRFGVEFGFAMQAGNTPDRYYRFLGDDSRPLLGETGTRSGISSASLLEEWIGLEVRVEFERPFLLWFFPIETVSSSEAGFERTYQSSVVLPHWEAVLPPGGQWEVRGVLRLIDLTK